MTNTRAEFGPRGEPKKDAPQKFRRTANGLDEAPNRIIIDPKAPYDVARLFIDQRFSQDRIPTLHFYRGEFFSWDGRAYLAMAADSLRAELYAFLDGCQRHTRADGMAAVSPSASLVTNVFDALKAAANLEEKIEAPAWLNSPNNDFPLAELIACANGLLHLPSLTLLPHTPIFFARNALNFAYEPSTPQPVQWLHFLRELWPEDPDSINTLQEFFGYCLTCDTRQQKAFLLVGPKRSGKGTIGRILRGLVGESNCVAPTLAGLSQNFGLAPLIGKQVAIISDARLGSRADQHAIAERILSITGEDAITIDRKYLGARTGKLPTRFLLISNELPRLADTSGALASRFIVLVLSESFFGREDLTLTDRLLIERPAILNWAIEGWHRLTRTGAFRQPQSAADAVEALEDLSSPIRAFIRDRCEIGPEKSAGVTAMFEAWRSWCTQQGRDKPGTVQSFGRDFRAAVPNLKVSQRREDEGRSRYYEGIGLR